MPVYRIPPRDTLILADTATLKSDTTDLIEDVAGVQSDTDALQVDTAALQVDTAALLVDTASIEALSEEIEVHNHGYERWLGAKAVPTATSFADETETAFQIDSGNTVFGDWVQILGSDDTPIDAGKTYYDLHRLLITAAERTTPYRVQIGFGESGAAALSAGTYIVFMFAKNTGVPQPSPVVIQGDRQAAGTLCWARCRTNADTGTLNFTVGLHEYVT